MPIGDFLFTVAGMGLIIGLGVAYLLVVIVLSWWIEAAIKRFRHRWKRGS